MVFSSRLILELCENEHAKEKQEKKTQRDFHHKKKIHLHLALAAGLMEKRRQDTSRCTHGTTYVKCYVRTALPLDFPGVLKEI